MKDITHYFADLPRKSENAAVPPREVREERAKIEETAVVEEEPKPKRKRGRVKIKISRKSSEGTVCDIVDSSTDLVDKTPSPYPHAKRKHTDSNDETPVRKLSAKESPVEAAPARLNKKFKKSVDAEMSQENGADMQKLTCDAPNTQLCAVDEGTNEKKTEEVVVKRKKGRPRKEHKEKLIEMANKKGYSERKALEEKETEKMERILEKRKNFFTAQPKNNTDTMQSDENSPKNSQPSSVRRPGSLLNYFSKATPEHLEKERLMKAKLTVKAEIHTPANSPVFATSSSDKKKDSTKKKKSSAKQLDSEFDEIQLIQTETIVLSPKNEKIKSSTPQNKPKWSMKIQLQSNNPTLSGLKDYEDIYTPTASSTVQKENMKNSDKIPKILLPMKNRKSDLSSISLESHHNKKDEKLLINNNKEKLDKNEKKNLAIDKDEKLSKKRKNSTNITEDKLNKRDRKNSSNNKDNMKTDEQKTEINEKSNNCSIPKDNKIHDQSVEEIEMIEIVQDTYETVENNSLKRKSKEKLAPLFTKKMKPSAEVVAARRLFLQSDINENTNNNVTKKIVPLGPKMLPFPKITHVRQLELQPIDSTVTNQKFLLKNNEISHSLFDLSVNTEHKSILDTSIPIPEHLYECIKADIQEVLSEIESYCSDAQSLWKSVSAFSKPENSKRTPKTRRRTSEKKSIKKLSNPFDDLQYSPWTDKYKPNSTKEIVGNEEAAIKLKTWLDSWKSAKNNEDYSSSEEFYNSDGSLSSNIENNHVAVLIGPHGSGKTASVYAVAHELGYKVLEVNASSKRPGKKILKDFEEATKSHRVKKSTLKDAFIKIPKKEETQKISQNSLILFEDVDLIFEEDEGFVSASFQLASNTKRPIVMTLRDSCSHLLKMAPQQFRINFQPVSGKRVSALLQLIVLAETGCKISLNCVDALCQNGDLRKALLQLQYISRFGKDKILSTSLSVSSSMWKEIKVNLYKPAIKADKSKKKKQISDDKKLSDEALDNLVSNLDRFSIISTLIDIEDPTSHLIDAKYEPSMSLSENMTSYSTSENMRLEIGNWLINAVMTSTVNDSKKLSRQIDSSNHLLTKMKINRDVGLALSQIASNTSDRRALSVDYLSSLRTICRAEEIRNQLNSKRGNRFFHYLQNSRLASGAAKSGNILSAACTMLQEKHNTTDT